MKRILRLKYNLFLGCLAIMLLGYHVCNAYAQASITLAVVPGSTALVETQERAEQLVDYLRSTVDFDVQLRVFRQEKHLDDWLNRFREVDVALLSEDFVRMLSPGQVQPLATAAGIDDAPLHGLVVARQGVDAVSLQALVRALVEMPEHNAGRATLAALGVARFQASPAFDAALAEAQRPVPEAAAVAENRPIAAAEIPDDLPAAVTTDVVNDRAGVTAKTPSDPPLELVDGPGGVPPAEAVVPDGLTVSAQDLPPMDLEADSLVYNKTDDTYEASGDVRIRRGATLLTADQVVWQTSTQDAAAQGQVSLTDEQGTLWGRSLQVNLATGQGKVTDGRIQIKERNFSLLGDEIEKMDESNYQITGGSFTTCDGDEPDWKFTAEHLDVTLGSYLEARNVWFHVKDVPLLYTPYLLYPVKSERESGLLTPWFGYSQNKGVRASLAWYQVIDRNLDATVYLDYYSKMAVGKGLEYRYFLADDNTGRAFYYHVSGISDTPDMYALQWEHGGTLPGNVWLSADVEYVDDKTFFDEFGEVAEDYNKDKAVSTIWAQRNWEKLNVVGMARYIKDLESDNDATLQRLPELSLGLSRYRLGTTPLYASLESYATNFWRREGEEGQRLYLKPTLSASLLPGSWLEVVPEVALYERLYHADSGDEEMAIPEYSLTLSTRLDKVFAVDSTAFDKIQHSIEPQVAYTYIPESSQSDLPLFTINDRIPETNLIDYQLINRLTGRFTGADGETGYREFAWLRLSQSYDVDEARDDNPVDSREPFSDLRVELNLYPTLNSYLTVDSFIPVYGDTQFRSLRLGGGASDGQGNAVSLSYNYRNEKLDFDAVDYLSVEADTALLKPLFLHLEERYDFQDRRELEKFVGLEYRAKCWSLVLTYRERYREDDSDDREYLVNFVLGGLSPNERVGMSRAFAPR
jgi:LPS-assembly protein